MCNDNVKYHYKLEMLKKKLGDLDKYEPMKWIFRLSTNSWERELSPKFKLEVSSQPNLATINMEDDKLGFCFCETKINRHFLVKHVDTKELYFVGSECFKRFFSSGDGMKRKCIQCLKPNRCHSLRCKHCRIKCDYHNEFHDDNRTCSWCRSCNKLVGRDHKCVIYCSICNGECNKDYKLDMSVCDDCVEGYVESILLYREVCFDSKHKTYAKMFKDKRYMDWVLEKGWFKRKFGYKLYKVYKSLQMS